VILLLFLVLIKKSIFYLTYLSLIRNSQTKTMQIKQIRNKAYGFKNVIFILFPKSKAGTLSNGS